MALTQDLIRLLDLGETSHSSPTPQPAGCCFWQPAEQRSLRTTAADHANCSVGSYTHGLIPLAEAAAARDTAALVGSGWVTEVDLGGAPRAATTPAAITYEPLEVSEDADVVLIRLTASSLMALQGACHELSLVAKPQCQIVPLALAGTIAVSPGCAVSRVRTGLPADELTCALPARDLAGVVARLERSRTADAAVGSYAAGELHS